MDASFRRISLYLFKKWVEVKHLNDLYFDQAEYDFIKAEEANCDDSTLPILPANDDSSGPQPGDKAPQIQLFSLMSFITITMAQTKMNILKLLGQLVLI